MVTAEAALVLPVLVLLLSVGIGALSAVTAQLRCVDAAREAARALARGEPVGSASELARAAAPDGATVGVAYGANRIVVTVRARTPIAGGLLPDVSVEGVAVAVPEPGTVASAAARSP
ncbi:TadE family type IV pilus minor pilin [soil metagenome]